MLFENVGKGLLDSQAPNSDKDSSDHLVHLCTSNLDTAAPPKSSQSEAKCLESIIEICSEVLKDNKTLVDKVSITNKKLK